METLNVAQGYYCRIGVTEANSSPRHWFEACGRHRKQFFETAHLSILRLFAG